MRNILGVENLGVQLGFKGRCWQVVQATACLASRVAAHLHPSRRKASERMFGMLPLSKHSPILSNICVDSLPEAAPHPMLAGLTAVDLMQS
eukprot:224030-Amphidinium_carterae.1